MLGQTFKYVIVSMLEVCISSQIYPFLNMQLNEADLHHLYQYPKIRLFAKSREVSKPHNWYLELKDRADIWQASQSKVK